MWIGKVMVKRTRAKTGAPAPASTSTSTPAPVQTPEATEEVAATSPSHAPTDAPSHAPTQTSGNESSGDAAANAKSPIDIRINEGYVLRKLFDVARMLSDAGVLYLGRDMFRFQACGTGQGRYEEALPFLDVMLSTDHVGHYEVHPPDDNMAIVVPVSMSEMQKATAGTRKLDQICIVSRPNLSHLLLTTGGNDNPGVRFVHVKTGPMTMDPPAMDVDVNKPLMSLDVATFCSEVAEFSEKIITHVKIIIHPTHMDWIGYHDEHTAVRAKRFGAAPASTGGDLGNASVALALLAGDHHADDVTGSTFYLSKKTINALSKIKPVPAEKTNLLVYHAPHFPLKFCFSISSIGEAHLYFIQSQPTVGQTSDAGLY